MSPKIPTVQITNGFPSFRHRILAKRPTCMFAPFPMPKDTIWALLDIQNSALPGGFHAKLWELSPFSLGIEVPRWRVFIESNLPALLTYDLWLCKSVHWFKVVLSHLKIKGDVGFGWQAHQNSFTTNGSIGTIICVVMFHPYPSSFHVIKTFLLLGFMV